MLKRDTSRNLFLVCLLFPLYLALPARAFNPESAELTFHADSTNTSPFRYFFKLVYYTTKSLTVPGVSPTAQIKFSDGSPMIQVMRSSRSLLSTNATLYREVYYFEHQFPATGVFNITFFEINRRVGYLNIPQSENLAFLIRATVHIRLEAAGNRSPQFLANPIKLGILGQPYRHNVTTFDPDGDSLAFKLVPAMRLLNQDQNQYIPTYVFPAGATINNRTGEFYWPNPDQTDRFGVVIEVWEYRQRQLIGKVMRELSLTIEPNGLYPTLEIRNRSEVPVNARNQVFITGSAPVKIRVAATNASNLMAYSELFRYPNSITSQPTADNPREIEVTITPNAALRRSLPYIITFRGTPPTTDPEIFHQQDLTVALYFRPERAIDQQDTTQPGEIPVLEETSIITGSPKPNTGELVLKVFPNPVQGWFKIVKKDNKSVILRVYNADSQLVLDQKFNQAETIIQRRDQLRPGIYYYILFSEAGVLEYSGKLLFQ